MKIYQQWMACGRKAGTEEYCAPFPAEVPGNVQYDYARAMGFSDFAFGTGVKLFSEVEDMEWEYLSTLDVEREEGEKLFLVAEGIDYSFDISLDGELLYSGEGMYSRVELEVTDKAKNGSSLKVHIHPHPKREDAANGTRDEADRCCKPPVCYGWDWNPRLLISGIWEPFYLEKRREGHINSCELFYKLSADRSEAEIHFETECDAEVTYSIYDPDGELIYKG
ncbi:MAG: hypothetical protein E7623_04460, partial [Ruminococcaceae bacterium]|nr:hypothetical protein [Oscillospiraceae bacterium]